MNSKSLIILLILQDVNIKQVLFENISQQLKE